MTVKKLRKMLKRENPDAQVKIENGQIVVIRLPLYIKDEAKGPIVDTSMPPPFFGDTPTSYTLEEIFGSPDHCNVV